MVKYIILFSEKHVCILSSCARCLFVAYNTFISDDTYRISMNTSLGKGIQEGKITIFWNLGFVMIGTTTNFI